MLIRPIRILIVTALLAPLALGLSACKKETDDKAGLSGDVIAKVAAPAGKVWSDVVAKTPEGGYLLGNPNAAIKLVEYGSLSCPHCAKVAQEGFQQLSSEFINTGRVNFEFRSFAIHPQDVPLTMLAACGGAPETFIPRIEQLYKNFDSVMATAQSGAEAAQKAMALPPQQRFIGMSEAMRFTDFFATLGVSKDQAKACLMNVSDAQTIAKQTESQSEEFNITGTPTFIINGNTLGTMGWQELRSKLQTMGAR